MGDKRSGKLGLVGAVWLLALLACAPFGEAQKEPAELPPPTVKPLIKPTHTPQTEEPTETPVKAATETPLAAPLELQERAYEHPEGYFSLYAPLGWALDEGSAGSS